MLDDFYGKRALTIHIKILYAMPGMRAGGLWSFCKSKMLSCADISRHQVNSEKHEGHRQAYGNCIKLQLFTRGILETKMKIVVFGTGGVGGYFGARLAQSGEDVTFIAHGEHLAAIRGNGLLVEASWRFCHPACQSG